MSLSMVNNYNFDEYNRDQVLLTKYHQKRLAKNKDIIYSTKSYDMRVEIVTAQEVIEKLAEMGLSTTERTLQRYVKAGLIPIPDRRNAGRGKGKATDYPDETVNEFYASWVLSKGTMRLRQDDVRKAREAAQGGEFSNDALSTYFSATWKFLNKGPPKEETDYSDFEPDDPLYKSIKAKMDEWQSRQK